MKVFNVNSTSRNMKHQVSYNEETGELSCTCEHHRYRKAFCKHMKFVMKNYLV